MNDEMIKEYKAMAAASPDSMKAKIEANLRATCDKFPGHEDRLDDCMEYLTECAREILNGKNGEVDDDTCYRICRDYFNDEIWAKEDEAKAEKKAKKPVKKTASQVEKESVNKEKQRIEKLKEKHGCKPAEPEKTCKADEEAKKVELEKMQAEAAREAEALKKAEEKKINDKIRAQIAEKNKELGIGMAQPIDMFAEAV